MGLIPMSSTAQQLMDEELLYSVGGSTPLPAFIVEARGSKLWDIDGKEYIDFVCMFGAVNQGHSHPVIVDAVKKQMDKAALVNAATHNAMWPGFARMMCQRFGYDKIASTVSGTDAVDAACKIARKWAITKKQVPAEQLLILGVSDCYHGLASGVWGLQNRSSKRSQYGLEDKHLVNYNPSTGLVLRYGSIEDMRECFVQHHSRIAAVILECLRGHLRTFQEEIEYARGVFDLCRKYNALFIADEIRMGVCRTGRFLCSDHLGQGRKPDIVTLGKSITGGIYPASYVMGHSETMDVVGSREIVSTFAFSPLGIAATAAALQVADEQNLCQRARRLQKLFTDRVRSSRWEDYPFILHVTCTGGDFGIWFNESKENLCRKMGLTCMSKGLLIFPKDLQLRMSSTLVIDDEDFERALDILDEALEKCLISESKTSIL